MAEGKAGDGEEEEGDAEAVGASGSLISDDEVEG